MGKHTIPVEGSGYGDVGTSDYEFGELRRYSGVLGDCYEDKGISCCERKSPDEGRPHAFSSFWRASHLVSSLSWLLCTAQSTCKSLQKSHTQDCGKAHDLQGRAFLLLEL